MDGTNDYQVAGAGLVPSSPAILLPNFLLTFLFLTMTKLKQISAKIDAGTIEKIDALAARSFGWSRNMVLNQIMTAVMDGADLDSLRRMMHYDRESGGSIRVTCLVDGDT